MRVVLLNPPSPFLLDQGVFPPLGLWYLHTVLEQHGHDCRTVDLGLDNNIPEADVYGITGTTPQAYGMKQTIEALKPRGKKIIAGGPHATLHPHEVLSWGADAVVIGEGERAILPALTGDEQVYSAPRMTGAELDALPLPVRPGGWRYHFDLSGTPTVPMITSRGCPYSCSFCCHAIWGQKVSFRSAENVLREANYLRGMGVRGTMMWDDTFTLDRPRLHAICDGLKEMNLKWRCFIRSDITRSADLQKMAEAGCVEVGIGVESGSQKILDNVNKGTRVSDNTRVVQWCKAIGITAKTFIIIGLPGETEETVRETKEWLVTNRPPKADITLYVPYPGTPITNHPEQYDIRFLPAEYDQLWYKGHADEAKAVVSTSALSSERLTELRGEVEEAWQCALRS